MEKVELREDDWKIVRQLLAWDAENYPRGPLRISLRDLSARTHLHPNTVWSRMRAMRRSGLLEGQVFAPLPEALGHYRSGYMFDGLRRLDTEKLDLALRAFPWVEWVVFARDFVFAHFWHRHPSGAAEARALGEELGAKEIVKGYASADFAREAGKPPRLTALDWKLILALRRGSSRSLAAVAREIHVTARTAERRAKRLIDARVGSMQPRLRPSKVEGWLLVEYIAWEGDARAAAALAKSFPDRVIGPFGPRTVPNVAVPVRNLHEMERRAKEAEALPGVGPVDPRPIQDIVYPVSFSDWLESLVAASQASRG